MDEHLRVHRLLVGLTAAMAVAACGASASVKHPPATPHSLGPISDAEAQRLLNACKVKELVTTHNSGIQLILTDGNWAIWRIPANLAQLQDDFRRRCKRGFGNPTE